MARTAIENGCKAVSGASAVDTAGYGKVTLIYSSTASVSVKHGDTAGSATVSAADWVIDPSTGAKAGANAPATLVLSYVGSKRFIVASDAIVLLSEPVEA